MCSFALRVSMQLLMVCFNNHWHQISLLDNLLIVHGIYTNGGVFLGFRNPIHHVGILCCISECMAYVQNILVPIEDVA